MDFTALLSTDSPFKFFFLSGVLLIVVGLYYPFDKGQKLDFKKNDVEYGYSKLTTELQQLQEEIINLKTEAKETITVLDSLSAIRENNPLRSSEISLRINEIKNSSRAIIRKIDEKVKESEIKGVSLEHKAQELLIYKSHLLEIIWYSIGFFIIGLILLVYGGRNWLKDYKKKSEYMMSKG